MSQRTPIWPYVLVLACLFALALVAPHGWDHSDRNHGSERSPAEQSGSVANGAGNQNSSASAALVQPGQFQTAGFAAPPENAAPSNPPADARDSADSTSDGWQLDVAAELKNHATDTAQLPPADAAAAAATSSAGPAKIEAPTESPATGNAVGDGPILGGGQASPSATASDSTPGNAEPSAPAVLELHGDVSLVGETLAKEFSQTLHTIESHLTPGATGSAAAPPGSIGAAPPNSLAQPGPRVAARPRLSPANAVRASELPASELPASELPASQLPPSGLFSSGSPPAAHAWPTPKSLLDALRGLAKQDDAALENWTAEVEGQIAELDRLQPRQTAQAAALLKQLRHSVEKAAPLADHSKNIEQAFAIRRVQYALVRRLDIWEVVCEERQTAIAASMPTALNRRRMELCLADVGRLADRSGTAGELREHLKLDTLSDLAKRDDESTADERRRVAHEVLQRIAERRQTTGRLASEDRPIVELDRQLRRWDAEPTDSGPAPQEQLLALLEQYEATGQADDARRLAALRTQLGRSAVPADNDLGRRLDVHYRNANLRVVLSKDLINRLLPEQATTESPVNDTILGTPIRGRSTTSTALRVRLFPSPQSWRLAFEAAGNVDSQTSATYGPVTFVNHGAAQFYVQKKISIDVKGMHVERAAAAVDNNTTVEGIRTQYDNIPLVRSMVRNYAMSQRQQKEAEANQEAEEKIRQAACWRVDSQLEPRLTQLEKNFRDRLLTPIANLNLNPTIENLETSDARLTIRTRLAGDDQLAAYTPRPDAPGDSLASMQMHESAINNLLDHLGLAGRTFTIPELQRLLNEKLNRESKPAADDLPADVEITFAKSEPLRVRCTGGRIELTLAIAEIRQGKRRWHDFEVRTAYRADAHGLTCELERDGSIELGGQYKGKTEVALRGIFSKVLSRDRKFNLLPESLVNDRRLANLAVTQVVVEDGWIAVAIGPAPALAGRMHSIRRF